MPDRGTEAARPGGVRFSVQRLAYGLVPALVVGAGACSGNDLLLPAEGVAAKIVIVRGDGQSGVAGGALPDSLVVRVTDSKDRPVENQRVDFTVNGPGGGTTSPATRNTNSDGRSGSRWVLGTAVGAQTVTAKVVGNGAPANLSVTFTATAMSSRGRIAIVQQPSASAQSGVPFPQQPVVQLRDALGGPVAQAGIAVTAGIESAPGDGATPSGQLTVATDGNGVASFANLALTGPAGSYTLRFTNPTFDDAVSDAIVLGAGAAAKLGITTQPPASMQSGSLVSPAPVVQVLDAFGNAVAQGGIQITATLMGGGLLTGTTTVATVPSGQASFTDLRITSQTGDHALRFTAAPPNQALGSVTSNTIVIGVGPVSPSESSFDLDPTTIQAGTGTTGTISTVTVTAKDASGTPVPGATVVVAVTGSNNNVSTPAPTGADGKTTATISSTRAEQKTVTVTINGVSVTNPPSRVLTVTPGPANADASRADVPAGKVAAETKITVQAKDAFGNNLTTGGSTVTVTVSGDNPVGSLTVTDVGNGTYTASYTPSVEGTDDFAITLDGAPIGGGPYTSQVGPAGP